MFPLFSPWFKIHPHRYYTTPCIPKPQLCLYVFLRFPQIHTPVASRTQKLKTPCRSEQELSSFTDAEATNKFPNLSSSGGVRVYLNDIQSSLLSTVQFLCLCLGKEGPFQVNSEVNSDYSVPYPKRINR